MRRRDIIAALCAASIFWPQRGFGQTPKLPVIGILSIAGSGTGTITAFLDGLKESGLREGRDFALQFRSALGDYERLPTMAGELAALGVSLIATIGGEAAALAAQAATSTIPIVFTIGSDPVRIGLVASMNRPGANATGVSMLIASLVSKQLELLHELLPSARSVALIINRKSGYDSEVEAAEATHAASATGQDLVILKASNEEEINSVFVQLAERHVNSLIMSGDVMFGTRRDQIIALAARYSVPAIYPWRIYAASGGLVVYGPDLFDAYRRSGIYAARILRGERPAGLPVLQPTKFPLIINLRTARSLGLAVPPPLFARADELIE
jgi:putative ABC transport system substrate-binding protein